MLCIVLCWGADILNELFSLTESLWLHAAAADDGDFDIYNDEYFTDNNDSADDFKCVHDDDSDVVDDDDSTNNDDCWR